MWKAHYREYLKTINIDYGLIAISETSIMRNLEIIRNIDVKNDNKDYILA